jgi:uracil DNA glycosylase
MASSSYLYAEVDEIVPDTWKSLVGTIMAQPNAENFVGKNRDAGKSPTTLQSPTLPVRELTFRALVPFPPEDWNVIIFGQNPYPRLESATGIAMFDGQFKDWQGTLSPSLRNIIKNAVMTELPKKADKGEIITYMFVDVIIII